MKSTEGDVDNLRNRPLAKWMLLVVLLVIAMALAYIATWSGGGGITVEDLSGGWEVEIAFDGGRRQPPPRLTIFIQDIEQKSGKANAYLANGCMLTSSSDAHAPLSLEVLDNQDGTFRVRLLSTVVESAEEAYLIRLDGDVETQGGGVRDDTGEGTLRTEFAEGTWSASHVDRDPPNCPDVDLDALIFEGDIYIHRDLAHSPPLDTTLFGATTLIVSSAMLVERPDGTVERVTAYSDIFSPEVDFVSVFRYLINLEGTPMAGERYRFTLLDVHGNPIPGAESADYWFGCVQGTARNLAVQVLEGDGVLLSWDAVEIFPGEFDPPNQVGQYQVNVFPFDTGGPTLFGAHQIGRPSHLMPWQAFDPDSPGIPDGVDLGVSLSELPDDIYQINVTAFSVSSPENQGYGLECAIWDSSEDILMEKSGDQLSFRETEGK